MQIIVVCLIGAQFLLRIDNLCSYIVHAGSMLTTWCSFCWKSWIKKRKPEINQNHRQSTNLCFAKYIKTCYLR